MEIELFFDYACPYCFKGHKNLLGLRESYPNLTVIWRPCEAHPRPEPARIHSDLAIQGMYFIRDCQGDLWNYHLLVYEGIFDQKSDISDVEFLTGLASRCGADSGQFRQALLQERYARDVEKGNDYAWREIRLHAVPSYRSSKRLLGSRDGIMVSKNELKQFLSELSDSSLK